MRGVIIIIEKEVVERIISGCVDAILMIKLLDFNR